jgi:hypothetical protein
LDALAAAMRLTEPTSHSFPNQHLLSRPEFRDEFEVHRAGPKLTLWRISREHSNTLSLVHTLLGNDKIKAAVVDAALSLVGVTAALSRRSNAIQISCQPGLFSVWALLDVIESALAHALPLSKRPKAGIGLKPTLIRANLALAPIADYVFPPLGLANAALVVCLSAMAAFARPKTDSQSTRLAELLVGPVLLLGLAALGRGGIHMTKAVIRPDYFSGPAIPNVAAIAAAVVLNAPALVSVIMTTLGAATCYHRASRLLRQAAG